MSYSPRLKGDYSEKIIKDLQGELELKNLMQVPTLDKIVISRGVGAAVSDKMITVGVERSCPPSP